MLATGMKAPDFTLKNQHGEEVRLSDFLGKKVVLYFYPKDSTPGCTRQACAFAASYEAFKAQDIVVIGVSKDSVASHVKFAEKYDLPFVLLSDRSSRPSSPTACGRRRRCAARPAWAWCAPPSSLMSRASSSM